MLKNLTLNLIAQNYPQSKERLMSLLRPSIGFKLVNNKPDFNSSRIGGKPPILNNIWPYYNQNPLTFIAQINLSEIKQYNDLLPKEGYLSFFIYTGDLGYRYPDQKGEFKVLYTEKLETIDIDKNYKTINEHQVSFFEYFTFPSFQENFNLTDEEFEIIDDIETETIFMVNESFETEHQLLGHPRAMQGTVSFWWGLQYLGIEMKDSYTEEEIKKIFEAGDKFILLLQINFGDPYIEIDHFGDSVAYFGIHKDDLKNKNYDNVLLVMQNT